MAKYESIAQAVGRTPVVPLPRVGEELRCELWGKCEFLNPGGSLKDRIGARMVLEAERSGRIKPGDTLIEPTSGNTGIGMAMVAAARGYRMIVTMPEKMSREKQVVLEALGAEIVRTPTEAAWDAPESHIGVAKKLEQELPRAHILDQYSNPDNPDAHYYDTAEEILEDFGSELAMVVIGVGTGGTVTGVARRLKKERPDVIIVGVDPYGSILAGPGEIHSYLVEGIGYDFIPEVLDNSLVDRYVKTADKESFLAARRLIREEGLLVGGSSGAVLWAAWQVATDLAPGQSCLCILPDSIRNYMTKFIDDDWMREQGFLE
jgi:cystathionine beta-synthase/cysteine synthase A